MLQLTDPGSPQVSGRRSPEPCSKPEKILKKATYDKVGVWSEGVGRRCLVLLGAPAHCRASPQAYTDELVELHRRLMALRERNVLQQVLSPSPQAWA